MLRRSSSVVPPQTPAATTCSKAQARQALRARQASQIRLASRI
jgi:hypothetical protein